MSRGAGRWQRAILAVLDRQQWATPQIVAWHATHHALRNLSRSDQVAIRRAFDTLAARGCAEVVPYWACECCGALLTGHSDVSDREIARQTGSSPGAVGRQRAQLDRYREDYEHLLKCRGRAVRVKVALVPEEQRQHL